MTLRQSIKQRSRSDRLIAHPPPSPLACPDTLLRIHRAADRDTLCKCLRESKLFYQIAGPILYREVEIVNDVDRLLRGAAIVDRARGTRSSPAAINLKRYLLSKTKFLEMSICRGCPRPNLGDDVLHLLTLRVVAGWRDHDHGILHLRSNASKSFTGNVSLRKIIISTIQYGDYGHDGIGILKCSQQLNVISFVVPMDPNYMQSG